MRTVTVTTPGVATSATVTVTVPASAPVSLTGEVRIGVLIPLTGPLSTFGIQYRAVTELAERKINEYLSSLGRPWRIKLVIEDTTADPKVHLEKLISLHGTGIRIFIGTDTSAELSEAFPYCNANRILIISPASTSLALALKDMALRYTPNDAYHGRAIAEIMWLRGIRWVIPFWRGDTWDDGLAKYTLERFKEIRRASGESCGVLEADAIRYDPAAKEFSAEVAKLASTVEKAVAAYGKDKVGVLLISFEEAAVIFAAAKAYPILWEVRWQGSDGTAGITPLLDPTVADMVVRVELWSTLASPGISPHAARVREYIRETLGMEALGYAYFQHDIAWTVALALDMVGSYDPEAVLRVLPLVLEGTSGPRCSQSR